MMFDKTVKILLESQQITPEQLAQKFKDDVLSKYVYKQYGDGHLNCAWATKTFCEWCTKVMKLPVQAIYFVWPDESKVKRMGLTSQVSHVAPVYNGYIVDITFGQFNGDEQSPAKITPLKNWENTYRQFGYDKDNVFQGKPHFKVGSFKAVESFATELGTKPAYLAPPLKPSISSKLPTRMPNISNARGSVLSGAVGLASVLNDQLPPEMENSYKRSRGGYGVKGKFVAEP